MVALVAVEGQRDGPVVVCVGVVAVEGEIVAVVAAEFVDMEVPATGAVVAPEETVAAAAQIADQLFVLGAPV